MKKKKIPFIYITVCILAVTFGIGQPVFLQAAPVEAVISDSGIASEREQSAAGVSWTGTEWNGSINGEIGERNCDIVQIGRESARTDSIPYATEEQAVQSARNYQKELSPYYLLLSQTEWKFHWQAQPEKVSLDYAHALIPEDLQWFISGQRSSLLENAFSRIDFDDSDWEEINVPSVWQTQGYDHPIYTNTSQKFARNFGNDDVGYPRDLPKAPTEYNPVGLYRHTFEVPADWEGDRIYLDLEGVDSAFYLWINGIPVGYAEDSFTTDEFDITDYVQFGKDNLIAVKVYRWCDGSWIEDQDFYDLSGIFRDVYLYATPQVRVRDFSIVTDFDQDYQDSMLYVDVMVHNYLADEQSAEISLTLLDAEQNVVFSGTEEARKETILDPEEETALSFAVPVSQPRKWSAEDPYLYTLVIEETTAAGTVYESCQVGFRKITYKTTDSGWFEGNTDDQDLICINGVPICFRGVDRHETHPELGYALTREVMEEDIRIMLENNINAVRTSHYPNKNYWYYLCDKYGIYVVDEANLECHSNMVHENERITEFLSTAIIDREYNMIRRDRNHASVVVWSLGNECKNPEILRTILVEEYPDPEGIMRVLHEYTKDRPWHYEQAREMYETGIDMFSGMYEEVDSLIAHGESDVAAPMIECEYEHAMGNSEGNFDEYWDAFDTYRNLQGGFIWDYIDQSIYLEAEDGTRYFGYGGDYGETVHDGNFCANGLLLPDRTVQPEMAEVKYHYSQVKFEEEDAASGRILIKNFFLFTDIADKYEVKWTLLLDDLVLNDGVIPKEQLHIPTIDPVSNQPGTAVLEIPLWEDVAPDLLEEAYQSGEYFLNLSVTLKETQGMLPAGFEIQRQQYVIPREEIAADRILQTASGQSGQQAKQDGVQSVPSPEGIEYFWSGDEQVLTVETPSLRVSFDKELGRIVQLQGREVFAGSVDDPGTEAQEGSVSSSEWRDLLVEGEGPKGDFFRGATDNDRAFGNGQCVILNMWKETGEYTVTGFEVEETENGFIRVEIDGFYPDLNELQLETDYTVLPEGFVSVHVQITPQYDEKQFIYLPVAGLSMEVPEAFEIITWFGNGPEETYQDRYKGTIVGRWNTTVTENYFPYMESSETGNHVGTRWITLTDENGYGLLAACVGAPFEYSALHYDARELDRAVHPYELEAVPQTILRVNALQMGVGGDNAWDTIITHEPYLLKEEQYEYGFLLGAISAGEDPMALARSWQDLVLQ